MDRKCFCYVLLGIGVVLGILLVGSGIMMIDSQLTQYILSILSIFYFVFITIFGIKIIEKGKNDR